MKRCRVALILSRRDGSAWGHAGRSAALYQRQYAAGVAGAPTRQPHWGAVGPRRQWKKSWRAVLAIPLLTAVACNPKPPESKDYVAKVAAERTSKDAMFQGADDPVPKARHGEFLPLSYFPIDPEYDVPAQLKPNEDGAVMQMPTSTGTQRQMRRVGALEFTLRGQALKLTAFVEADAKTLDRLFVPFNDMTSGTETYPGGRYMDLDRTATGIYEVDFNRAYHPYCVYNPTYECPIPPPENRLKTPIRAGEKLKKSAS
jgi:uncharacterized protein (DUF1684 family)